MNAINLTLLFTVIISIVTIEAECAFSTIIGFAISALMTSYLLSIGCLVLRRWRKEQLPPASWSLGKAGLTINCLALGYGSWAFFWSFWPVYYKVNRANFNYTCVLFVVWVGFAVLMYIAGQRRMRQGPMEIVPRWTPR